MVCCLQQAVGPLADFAGGLTASLQQNFFNKLTCVGEFTRIFYAEDEEGSEPGLNCLLKGAGACCQHNDIVDCYVVAVVDAEDCRCQMSDLLHKTNSTILIFTEKMFNTFTKFYIFKNY